MSNKMKQIDLEKELPTMKASDQYFIKKLQAESLKKANAIIAQRRRARISGAATLGAVVGIYFYTLYAVKQENFLDFEEKPDLATKKSE